MQIFDKFKAVHFSRSCLDLQCFYLRFFRFVFDVFVMSVSEDNCFDLAHSLQALAIMNCVLMVIGTTAFAFKIPERF